jgi:two-component system, LuxR family, sensor kinase FixL
VPTKHASPEITALLEATVDAVVMVDQHGLITDFNSSAERLFGYDSDDVVGKNVRVLMNAGDRDRHDDYMSRYERTHEARIIGIGREVQARRKNGTEFPVFLSIGQIPDSNPPRYVGYMHDVSARRAAEDEARHALSRLNHVARLATMGEMAAGLSHELNQPLAAINNYARACARLLAFPEPDVPEVQGALQEISSQALRAGEIIRRLRSLVRNEEARRDVVDVNQVIRDIESLLRSDARVHDARLVLDLSAELPPVSVDAIQIQQVILNLVHNGFEAVKALPDDARREVAVHTRLLGRSSVEVRVCDLGPGLDAEMRGRVFEPFFTTKADGTGLGLAISKSIIKAHGTELAYEPNQPFGACFLFTLPT